ncbi:hypothetical protein GCM10028868_36370 [Virgibacillus kimchii]
MRRAVALFRRCLGLRYSGSFRGGAWDCGTAVPRPTEKTVTPRILSNGREEEMIFR